MADAGIASAAAPLSAAAASGYPDATNTGVPAGTQMTTHNGDLTVTADNTVISNMTIYGSVIVNADNVTFKNVKVITSDFYAVRVLDGSKNFTMQDSEVDGLGATSTAIWGKGTFLRNNIHGAENGIDVPGGDGPTLIKDNYIHGLKNTGSPHYDALQIDGAHDVSVIHNTIVNDHGQTSAIMLSSYWEDLYNITVEDNLLWGGGYTVYVEQDEDAPNTVFSDTIKLTDNKIGGGYYGTWYLKHTDPIISGTTDLTEKPTDPASTGRGPSIR